MAARDWHKSDIKAALEKCGLTLSALDQDHCLPDGTCSAACRKPHVLGEQIIAGRLGLSPRQIWPSRYRDDGIRLRPQPADNYRPGGTRNHKTTNPRCLSNSGTTNTEQVNV